MRRILVLSALCFILSFSANAQQKSETVELNVNTIERLKDVVRKSPKLYQQALSRYASQDSTYNMMDLAVAYYGYTLTDNYKGGYYHEDADKVNDLLKAGKKVEAYKAAIQAMKTNPVSLSLLYYGLCSAPENSTEYFELARRFKDLCECVLAFGSGEDCDDPHMVIYVADEYMIMYHYLGISVINQSLMEDFCDKIEYKDKDGQNGSIYFSVKSILEKQAHDHSRSRQ